MGGEADMGGKKKGRPDLAPSPNKTGPNYFRATPPLSPPSPASIFAPHVRNPMSDGGGLPLMTEKRTWVSEFADTYFV